MLSRRRSSEQTVTPPHNLASSASSHRLEASLRAVNVLFSVIATPDVETPLEHHPNAQADQTDNNISVPSTPSTLSSPQPPLPHLSHLPHPPPALPFPAPTVARRRLFSSRYVDSSSTSGASANASAGSHTAPIVIQRLVVTASVKNANQLRLHQINDNLTTGRISVVKAWNLSELRLIDGLGLPIGDSLKFGLFFSSSKVLVWKTQTPVKRAQFLWSLLQICASRLKRAPPVQRLKLLDLQTYADDPPSLSSTHQPGSSKSKSKSKSTKYAHLNHNDVITSNNSPHAAHAALRSRSDPHAAAAAAAVHIVDNQKRKKQVRNLPELEHEHVQEPSPASSSTTSMFVRSDRWQGQIHDGDGAPLVRHPPGIVRNDASESMLKAPLAFPGQSGRKLASLQQARQTGSTTTATATSVTVTTSATANSYKGGHGLQHVNSPQRASLAPAQYDHPANVQRVTRTLSEPKVSASMVESLVEPLAQPRTIMPRERRGHLKSNETGHGVNNLRDVEDPLVSRYERNMDANGIRDTDVKADEIDRHGERHDLEGTVDVMSAEESTSDDFSGSEQWLTRPPRKLKPKGRTHHKERRATNRQPKDRVVRDRDLNIDDRAFIAAAKRMGAKNLSPMCKAEVIEQFASVGCDPKSGGRSHAPSGFRAVGESGRSETDKHGCKGAGQCRDSPEFISRMDCDSKIPEEDMNCVVCFGKKKALGERNTLGGLRLSVEECDDLTYALNLFQREQDRDTLEPVLEDMLDQFGSWTERQIESLEACNMSSIVHAELEAEQAQKHDSSQSNDPLRLLMSKVTHVEPWLSKSETLLAPYARLARDIHAEVELLELQRDNVSALQAELTLLLAAVTFSDADDELLSDLDRDILELSPDPAEANYTHVFQAVEVIARRVNSLALPPVSKLADMTAVKSVRKLIGERQAKASRALLPCLRRFLDMQYRVSSAPMVTSTATTTSPTSPSSITASATTTMSPTGTGISVDNTTMTTEQTSSVGTSPQSTPESSPTRDAHGRQREFDIIISSVDDVRLNLAEEITSPVFSEYFKGARCLYMCCDSAFAQLVDHFVDVSSCWVRAVVRYTMGLAGADPAKKNDFVPLLIDTIIYACLSEGFSTYRLFAPILDEFVKMGTPAKPNCPEKIHFDTIMRRLVPDTLFVKEWLSSNSGDDGDSMNVQTGFLLHTAYVIESYVFNLEREREHELEALCEREVESGLDREQDSLLSSVTPEAMRLRLRDVVTRVEHRVGLEPLAPPNMRTGSPSASPSLGFQYSRALFDRMCTDAKLSSNQDAVHGYDVLRSKSKLHPPDAVLSRCDSLSPRSKVISLALPQLVGQCRSIMAELMMLVEAHVAQCVTDLSVDYNNYHNSGVEHGQDIDIIDPAGRAMYFERVRECVDLCGALLEVNDSINSWGAGIGESEVRAKTKTMCEKLIAAVMRHTEEVAANGPKPYADMVKMQAYAYVAAKLSSGGNLHGPLITQPSSASSTAHFKEGGMEQDEREGGFRDEFVMQLAKLSNRVRRHVMKQWIEQHVFNSVFEGLNGLVPSSLSPHSSHYTSPASSPVKQPASSQTLAQPQTIAKLRLCISTLKAAGIAAKMKSLVDTCMENAACTSAIVPIYAELVISARERMEQMLRQVRRDKSVSDLRPSLLSFSRQLLSILRGDLRRAQHKFKHY